MGTEAQRLSTLRRCWATPVSKVETDYELLDRIGFGFAARSRAGLPALVLPLPVPSAIGRRAAGCELRAHGALHYRFDGEEWTGPAAILECADPELVDSFAVLASDVEARAEADPTWQAVLGLVEEWQALLAPRGTPTAESELGLWGELWFLSQSIDVDRALASWRGPDRDSSDFFVDGIAAEVKTSRLRRQHHVSLVQVDPGIVSFESWLVSLWVKVDPAATLTVFALASDIMDRASDRADAMRRIARAGFTLNDRREFVTGYVLASEPEWYPVDAVPRVRVADPGVSQLRYRVLLDESRRASADIVDRLRTHFHERATA